MHSPNNLAIHNAPPGATCETPHAWTVGWKTDECPARDAPPAGLAVGFWPDIEVLRGK